MKKFVRRARLAWKVMRGKAGVATVTAVKIRADGTREDLGVIASGPIDMHADAGKAIPPTVVHIDSREVARAVADQKARI